MFTQSSFDDNSIIQLTIKLAPDYVFASRDIENVKFKPQKYKERCSFLQKMNYNLCLLKLHSSGGFESIQQLLQQQLQSLTYV